MTVLDKFFNGDQSALARIISFIEDREKDYQALLGKLYPKAGKATRVGFTGPPGAGKSSLVNCLAKLLISNGERVAIIAVDPSSPFTGGALLGDRIRLTDLPMDGSVYVRSMATRGSSGGLAAATLNVSIALDAFGYDYILIETVGVGQVELDIVDTCDCVVVTLVPESGDAIQALKAGLMEIADVFAVNKSDRPGYKNIVAALEMMLDIKNQKSVWKYPVIPTEAINNKNIDVLFGKINDFINYSVESGRFDSHRKLQIKKKIRSIIQYRLNRMVAEKLTGMADLDNLVEEIYTGKNDPYRAGEKLLALSEISINGR